MALADAAALNDGETSSSQLSSQLSSQPRSQPVEKMSSTALLPIENMSFVQQLMALLDDEASPYLAWMPDGKSFTIKNPKKFTSDQMPKLFKIRNMSSFVRKLTRWGFSRYHEKETMNSDIFRHNEFQKGNWEGCAKINFKCAGHQPMSSSLRKDLISKKTRTTTKPISVPQSTPHPVSPTVTSYPQNQHVNSQQHWKGQGQGQGQPMFQSAGHNMFSNSRTAVVDAALKSIVADRDWMKLVPDQTARVHLLTMQLIQEASQQKQLSDQALLGCWLSHLPSADVKLAQLAARFL